VIRSCGFSLFLGRFPADNNGGSEMNSQRAWEENIMPKNLEFQNIEQLLAEADELIQKINSD
jgi:hypothetical protein